MPKNDAFACTQCGACCRRIAKIAELARFDDGSGICKYLDKSRNLCIIYANRPEICCIDMMFERHFAKNYSKEQFYALNAKACNILQEIMGIPKRFRVEVDVM